VDDLLYLDNLKTTRGRSRVSGTFEQGDSELDVAGRKIWVLGHGKVYEATTDKNGVYELYDLPPGRYMLEPELPLGWRIDHGDTRGTTTISEKKRQLFN